MTYTSPDVMRLTGISPRELSHWCQRGLIPGQPMKIGSGRYREWTDEQIDRVMEIRDAITTAAAILEAARLPGHVELLRSTAKGRHRRPGLPSADTASRLLPDSPETAQAISEAV